MPEYIRKPNAKCAVCGKPVYRRPLQLRMTDGKAFCGQICYGISCRKEKPCIICGKSILASLHKKTCSRGCANRHRTGIRYKVDRPRDKAEYYKKLKIALFDERGRRCERCGHGRFEILEVHHKDRDRRNNAFANLELICPNCHAEEHYLKKSWLKGT